MNKKLSIEEVRALYIGSNNLTLQELSDESGWAMSTLKNRSAKERWVLLRKDNLDEEGIRMVNYIMSNDNCKTLQFYLERVKTLEKYFNKIDTGIRKLDDEVIPKDYKALLECYMMVSDKVNSLKMVKEKVEENASESLLDDIASEMEDK